MHDYRDRPTPGRGTATAEAKHDSGFVRPWLGDGEATCVQWPSTCKPELLGTDWEWCSLRNLQDDAAGEGVSFYFRGRQLGKRAKKEGGTGVKYYQLRITGPENHILKWYARLRNIMASKVGTFLGMPHPRKIRIFQLTNLGLHLVDNPLQQKRRPDEEAPEEEQPSDDEEIPSMEGGVRFLEASQHMLAPGERAPPEEAMVGAADDAMLDAAEHPHDARLQQRFRQLWNTAKRLLSVG